MKRKRELFALVVVGERGGSRILPGWTQWPLDPDRLRLKLNFYNEQDEADKIEDLFKYFLARVRYLAANDRIKIENGSRLQLRKYPLKLKGEKGQRGLDEDDFFILAEADLF